MGYADDVVVPRRNGANDFLGFVGAVVVDEDNLVTDVEFIEHLGQAAMHDRNRLRRPYSRR